MKILFDQGTPVPLRKSLVLHEISTAAELGWSELTNGELLSESERNGYDCLVTTDQNLKYQQNLSTRRIGIVVLKSASWPRIKQSIESVVLAIDSMPSGAYVEIEI